MFTRAVHHLLQTVVVACMFIPFEHYLSIACCRLTNDKHPDIHEYEIIIFLIYFKLQSADSY